MFCRMRRWRKEILVLVDMRFHVFDALCKRFGACLVGDDGPPPAARAQQSNIKPTSMVRTMVVMTARATTKVARAMVAGARLCILTEFRRIRAEFRHKAPASSVSARNRHRNVL